MLSPSTTPCGLTLPSRPGRSARASSASRLVCRAAVSEEGSAGSAFVTEIDGEEAFDAVMAASGERLVILNCSATWCGPCKLFKPTYNLFAEEYDKKARFLSVTGDKNESTNKLMRRLEVKTVPAFFFFKNGKEVSKFSGANKTGFRNHLTSLLPEGQL